MSLDNKINISNKLSSKEALNLLNSNLGMTKSDGWIKHSICIGNVAGIIAQSLGLDEEYAKTLGYIHDIGKRFGWNTGDGVLPHAINGYNYIKSLGYDDSYAGICLKHSFLNNDIDCLANDRDETSKDSDSYDYVKEYISKEYSIYDKIINLCDLMCTTKVLTIDKRLIDLLYRHGIFAKSHYHITEALKLKEYFDNLLGYNLYDLFPQIKENL